MRLLCVYRCRGIIVEVARGMALVMALDGPEQVLKEM
jgi:hypothetical protein